MERMPRKPAPLPVRIGLHTSIAGSLERAAEQAWALAVGGVDLLWIETISSAEELAAAVAGAAPTGLPIVATMTFDTRGRTMMGLTCAAAMALRAELAVRPAAFGANCGVGPAQLVESVLGPRSA